MSNVLPVTKIADCQSQDEEGRRILKATPYARKATEQGSENWNGYIMQILRTLRSADKANWHHRMVARVSLLGIRQKTIAHIQSRPHTFSMMMIRMTRELLRARRMSLISKYSPRPWRSKFGSRTMSEQEGTSSTLADMSDFLPGFYINSTIRLILMHWHVGFVREPATLSTMLEYGRKYAGHI